MQIKNSLRAPILVLVIYALLIGSRYIDKNFLEYQNNFYLSIVILQLLTLVLPGIFYCKLKGTGYSTRLRFRLFGADKLFFLLFALILLIVGSFLWKMGLYSAGQVIPQYTLYDTYPLAGNNSVANVLYKGIAFGILPAVTEEFVFRAILLTEYEENGIFCAVFFSSLLFAMLHFSLEQLPVYFFGGCIFALVTYTTQSVFAAIAVHFFHNLFGLFGETYLLRLLKQPENFIFYFFVLLAVFLFFFFLFCREAERIYYLYAIRGKPSPQEKRTGTQPKGKLFLEALVSPTFLICILLFVVVLFGLTR